ncbi:MAG: hypothetical protein ABL956_11255 [Hyphomonadaceae bacterium]
MTGEMHSIRGSAFEKAELTWRAGDDTLITRYNPSEESRDGYADVVAIRIAVRLCSTRSGGTL